MASYASRKCSKCGKTRADDMTVTFHRFPTPGEKNISKASAWAKFCWPDQEFSPEWLQALHNSSKVLCGRHFKSNDFYDNRRQKLSKFAIPAEEEEKATQDYECIKDSRISAEETQAAIPNEDTSPSIQKDVPKLPVEDQPQTLVTNETTPPSTHTAFIETDISQCAADESDYEAEEQVAVFVETESAGVLSCEECGQDADCGGKLYQCVECPRVVCAACEREERHRQHCLLRLPSRAVYDKLRTLYESLRDTVTAHLADDDEHSVPKEESNPFNKTSNEVIIQPYNDYPKHVETDNSKRILVKVPSLVKTGTELILVPGAESVPTPISVPAPICVPAPNSVPIVKSVTEPKSAPLPKSVPKLVFESRLPKPKSVHESISDGGPLMLNLPGDHGHRYTVISTGAAKWSCSEKAKPTSGTEGSESTTTAKRKKPSQKEDEEHMEVEYLMMTDDEEYW